MLRGFIYLITISFFAVSCSSTRRLSEPEKLKTGRRPPQSINTTPVTSSPVSSKRVYKDMERSSENKLRKMEKVYPDLRFSGNIENSNWLQFKFSLLTDVPVEALDNMNLLYYMEDWYGTPYRYGGNTKNGIDCSAFTLGLMADVFDIAIPRTAREQYEVSEHIEKFELHEGDLVFFNTRGGVSHVGVYLYNNKFVHTSTTSGVMISDLGEGYFEKRYIGAGRVKQLIKS